MSPPKPSWPSYMIRHFSPCPGLLVLDVLARLPERVVEDRRVELLGQPAVGGVGRGRPRRRVIAVGRKTPYALITVGSETMGLNQNSGSS